MSSTATKAVRLPVNALNASSVSTSHQEAFSSLEGRFKVGIWSGEPKTVPIAYDKDEFCLLLEGEVRLTDEAGESEVFRAGDAFVIPRGFNGTWETIERVRKYYVIGS